MNKVELEYTIVIEGTTPLGPEILQFAIEEVMKSFIEAIEATLCTDQETIKVSLSKKDK